MEQYRCDERQQHRRSVIAAGQFAAPGGPGPAAGVETDRFVIDRADDDGVAEIAADGGSHSESCIREVVFDSDGGGVAEPTVESGDGRCWPAVWTSRN